MNENNTKAPGSKGGSRLNFSGVGINPRRKKGTQVNAPQ